VILHVGRLDPDKNVDLVMHAAAKVLHEIDAQLFIVGDGKQQQELIQISGSLGIHQNCYFPGFVPKDGDLPGIFRMASVFVTASEIEVQSSVVLEAAASGLPVVTVQASSMQELVADGVSGYLIQPGDVNAMAIKVLKLLQNPERASVMGRIARRNVESHSNERFIQEHEDLYFSVCEMT
jgi:glycosyltransferase involved in cell wall biosynthesis